MMGFYGAGDVPGSNMIGPVLHDEELFATRRVTCVGQARTDAAPLAACRLVCRLIPSQTTCLQTVAVMHPEVSHGMLLEEDFL